MSHPDYKSDPELGLKVKEHLERMGLETPMTKLVNADMSVKIKNIEEHMRQVCLLYTSPSPRDGLLSRMPSSA